MKKIIVLVALTLSACAAQTAPHRRQSGVCRLEAARAGHHHRPRRLGHAARLRQDRRRRRVRPDVRAGRRRLQPRRNQLHQLAGPARRGGRREGDLARPAHEALHRSRRPEGEVRREPAVAEGADGRLGRRPQLLPGHASRREAARDHEVRAVDGAQLQRRQHRRRHRARQPDAARGFYGDKPATTTARARGDGARLAPPQRSRPDRTASRSPARTPRRARRCC